MAKNETFSILTGGAADSLDGILTPGNGDFAYGNVSGLFHGYTFDTSETGGENSPYQIKADDATTGSWMLGGFKGAMSHVRSESDAGATITTGTTTPLIFEDEIYDTLSEYNTTTGAFIPLYDGKYNINISARSDGVAWTATNNGSIQGQVDTVIYTIGRVEYAKAAATFSLNWTFNDTIDMSAGESFIPQLFFIRTAGNTTLSNSAYYNHITIDRIA